MILPGLHTEVCSLTKSCLSTNGLLPPDTTTAEAIAKPHWKAYVAMSYFYLKNITETCDENTAKLKVVFSCSWCEVGVGQPCAAKRNCCKMS